MFTHIWAEREENPGGELENNKFLSAALDLPLVGKKETRVLPAYNYAQLLASLSAIARVASDLRVSMHLYR